MKELYKPVFWSGFALSLAALYFSSEQAASSGSNAGHPPVLMQISIGDPVMGDSNAGLPVDGEGPFRDVEQTSTPNDSVFPEEVPANSDATSQRSSAFYSAAQEALKKQ